MRRRQTSSEVHVIVCALVCVCYYCLRALQYMSLSCFYKDYIFLECGLYSMFTVGGILLLIRSHCEGVLFSLYTFTPL